MKDNTLYHFKEFLYEKQQHLEYKLDKEIMSNLKHCKCGKMVESNIFNDMWCIRICPNGTNPRDAGKCALGLTLCGLPQNASKLRVQWTISCDQMNIHSSQMSEFSVTGTTKGCNIGTLKQFQKLDMLLIIVDITVLREYDNNGKESMRNILHFDPKSPMSPSQKPPLSRNVSNSSRYQHGKDNSRSYSNEMSVLQLQEFDEKINGKMVDYDYKLNVVTANIHNISNKMQKLADLLTKSLKLNKKNEQKIAKLLEAEEKRQSVVMELKNEVNRLKGLALNDSDIMVGDDMSPRDLLKIFLEKEAKISGYFEVFIENGFESIESLYDITMDDLKEIGIQKLFHRKQLIKCIRQRTGQREESQIRQSTMHDPEGSTSYY